MNEARQIQLALVKELLTDPVFVEQIMVSSLAVSQRGVLPDHIVDHHERILRIWGFRTLSLRRDYGQDGSLNNYPTTF